MNLKPPPVAIASFYCYLTAVLLFLLDLQVERISANCFLYALPIYLAYLSRNIDVLLRATILCIAMVVVGGLVSPYGGGAWVVIANRTMAIGVIILLVVQSRHALQVAYENRRQLLDAVVLNESLEAYQVTQARKRRVLMSVMEDARIELERRMIAEVQLQSNLEQTEDLVDALRAANEELESFAHFASHDLQEPLRNIIAYAGLLKDDLGELCQDSIAEDVAFIQSCSERMRGLIDDLLAYSRTGRSALCLEPTDMNEVVDAALDNLHTRLEETRAHIEREALPELTVDKRLFSQLYFNLVNNATKFTFGGRAPRITLTARQSESGWVLGVKDNGIGIDQKHAEQIFAPFKRLHGIAEYEGSGIGLAICKRIIEHHDGQIWVDSRPGCGAHFQFQLNSEQQHASAA